MQILAIIFQFYFILGLVFALVFVIWGIHKVDEDASGTHWFFRILMIPGSMAFWPILLMKWVRGRNHSTQ